ncbi:MAG: GntR family transcriptional regulator, partial [Butyricicoccus sp.]
GELESRGLVETRRTAGRTVTEDMERIRRVREELARDRIGEFLASMRALGYTDAETRTLIEHWDMKEADSHE